MLALITFSWGSGNSLSNSMKLKVLMEDDFCEKYNRVKGKKAVA